MNYDELKKKYGTSSEKKTSRKPVKMIAVVVLVVAIIAAAIIYFYVLPSFITGPEIEVIRKDTITDFTDSLLSIKPERGENYWLSFENNTFYCQKYIFSDNEKAEGAFEELKRDTKIIKEENYNFKEYSGWIFWAEKGASIDFIKNNMLFGCSAANEKYLTKVTEWFIKTYF